MPHSSIAPVPAPQRLSAVALGPLAFGLIALASVCLSSAPADARMAVGTDAQLFGCTEDAREPNDSVPQATALAGDVKWPDLSLCNGTSDYFRLDLVAGQSVVIRTDFVHASGDVDMELLDSSGVRIEISEGTVDYEEIRFAAQATTSVFLRVYGYEGSSNRYTLSAKWTDFSEGCGPDAADGNDPATAIRLEGSGRRASSLCIADEDWFLLAPPADAGEIEVRLSVPQEIERRIEVYLIDPDGDEERLVDPFAPIRVSTDAGPRLLQVAAGAGFGSYSLTWVPTDAAWARTAEVTGRVTYEKIIHVSDAAKGVETRPSRNVVVELVRVDDGAILADGVTDEDGRYRLILDDRSHSSVQVRVHSIARVEGHTVRVVSREDSMNGYVSLSPSFGGADDGPLARPAWDFHFEGDGRLAGAFNVIEQSVRAFRFVAEHQPAASLRLTVIWERGRPHACTSCYSDSIIYLGGGLEDPDQFDDSVILHEFGHFFVDMLSHDDSPGGNHNGDRTDPLIAFGEGVATAFSMLVLDSPQYLDTMRGSSLSQDFELARFPEAFGTSDGRPNGLVSEYLIAAVLWDQYDSGGEGVADIHDSVSIGAEGVMHLFLSWLPSRSRADMGASQTDMADWLFGAVCEFPEQADAIFSNAVDQHQYPLPREVKSLCPVRKTPPVATRTAEDEVRVLGDDVRSLEWSEGGVSVARPGTFLVPPGPVEIGAESGVWLLTESAIEASGEAAVEQRARDPRTY